MVCSGCTARATKVAWVSVTVSSIDTPVPSFRTYTPMILAPAAAPYSFEAARVMSKARI